MSDRVLQQGWRLAVPASTELRLRFWHLQDPTTPMPVLLTRCLTKGLPFHVSLPNTGPTNPHITIPRISASNSKTHLIPQERTEKVSEPMVHKYYQNLHTLLNHPNAYQFLACGGLIWRIVLHYAPHLYVKFLLEPVSGSPDGDSITPHEIDMLRGLTTNNNGFWPYPEWYEHSSRYNGEWTEANEAWFRKQAKSIDSCMMGCLRSGTAWQNTTRVYSPETLSDPTTIGTIAHARACCAKLVRDWPDLWERLHLIQLR
jgi:hypothetical protein